MFVRVCGDAEGDACGICIPGVCMCVCGDAKGDAWGIAIPGILCGDAEGEAFGITMPGILCGDAEGEAFGITMPGILCVRFLVAGRLRVGLRLVLRGVFRLVLAFAFGLDILMPGILLMS